MLVKDRRIYRSMCESGFPKSLSPGLAYMSKGFNAMVLIDKGCGGLGVTLVVF